MTSLENIAKALKGQKYPPVHLWEPDFCGDIDIRIASNGTWFYMGSPIGRMELVKLFSSVLRYDEDGEYYLVTPVEKLRIKVDVAPLLVVELIEEGEGQKKKIVFRTLTDDLIPLDSEHALNVSVDTKTQEPRPTIPVRENLKALINRPVFYELVEMAVPSSKGNEDILGVWSNGEFFPIGSIEE